VWVGGLVAFCVGEAYGKGDLRAHPFTAYGRASPRAAKRQRKQLGHAASPFMGYRRIRRCVPKGLKGYFQNKTSVLANVTRENTPKPLKPAIDL
jgi:hypothetical protein